MASFFGVHLFKRLFDFCLATNTAPKSIVYRLASTGAESYDLEPQLIASTARADFVSASSVISVCSILKHDFKVLSTVCTLYPAEIPGSPTPDTLPYLQWAR